MPKRIRVDPVEFYSRQIVMPELGKAGQERLAKSSVLIVGLGGLGCAAALYLALAGVGKLKLLDQDTVEVKNIHRQILYEPKDIKKSKVEVAATKLSRINPNIWAELIAENLRESNVDRLVSTVDCVVDGLDNMETRYTLNRGCIRNHIPYVFCGAIGFEGNISIFQPPDTPCLECIMPDLHRANLPTCETRGVLSATPGVMGTIEAVEAIKLLAGIEGSLKNRLLVCDLKAMHFDSIAISRRVGCEACSTPNPPPFMKEEKLTWICGRDTINVNPAEGLQIDLRAASARLRRAASIQVSTRTVLVFSYGKFEISLFTQGRMLIKNVSSEEEALRVYREVLSIINPMRRKL
jgi:adenylyltransferase/sulfurtransferase